MERSDPRVSILMTVFNGARFIEKSVGCVIDQSFSEWELIIIENGSTDGTAELVKSFGDKRIKREMLDRNIGRTPALQLALENAQGVYVAVLDADDICAPERLAIEIGFLDANPDVMVVGTWFNEIDVDGKENLVRTPSTAEQDIIDLMASSNPILHSSAMYRRKEAIDVGGYAVEYKYGADTNLWVSLMQIGKAAIIPISLASYRMYPENLTNQKSTALDVYYDGLRIYRRAAEVLPISKSARIKSKQSMTAAQFLYGVALLKRRRLVLGFSNIVSALSRNPIGILRSNRFRSLFSSK